MTLGIALLVSALGAAAPARDYAQRTLPNGLEVLVIEDHALPLVTVEIGVRNGAMTEPPELNGVSHLYEHMFFKGNKVIPDQEAFLQKSRDLGMVFNGSTETERVSYYFTTTAAELRSSLVVMRDAIETPLFNPDELAREKRVVIEEIDRDDATPFSHFGRALDQAMWKQPSYKDPLGNRATVQAATAAKLRLIQSRYYVPNNSVLIIAGDVEPATTFAWVAELFGAWPRAADPFVAHPVVVEPPLAESVVVVVEQPVQTVDLGFEWQGPSARPGSSPATLAEWRMTYAADLLSLIVGQSGSVFQRDLVESGACLRADLSWQTQAHIGPVSFGLEATPEGTDGCVRAALAELVKLGSAQSFTEQDLETAKVQLEVHKALDREVTSQYAHLLSFFWSSPGLAYYEGYLPGMRGMARADLQRFLQRYVLGFPGAPAPPFVFGALLSPELRAARGYDRAHFEALLGLGARTQGRQ